MKRLLRKIKDMFNIKRKIAFKKFDKECLHLPCTACPYFIDDGRYGKCELAVRYGLEEL